MRDPDKIEYLDHVGSSAVGRAYKRHLLGLLNPGPGDTALDVGCGPGVDLADLAARAGTVIGVDDDPRVIAHARDRHPTLDLRIGDAHRLPVDDAAIDRARVDRVLHQVDDPTAVLAEVRRVLRPGGTAVLAQPDYTTLAVDPGDWRTTRAISDFVCESVIPNPAVGRTLPRLARAVGLTVRTVLTTAPLFDDHTGADRTLGLTRNAERAVVAGALDRAAADAWLAALDTGPFLATMVLVVVVVANGS
ncbi:methyltransferase domain-containing protein [Actinokineospora enzanensis]|uniref:methyltransferase domain-containing protein n=1 Tax=Actinokineospora enzanensis TaxID=155975 RepID=UPI00037332E9|nr:methyltransferase domain-containing protein [Actinokineospora enzanensis]